MPPEHPAKSVEDFNETEKEDSYLLHLAQFSISIFCSLHTMNTIYYRTFADTFG